MTGPGLHRKNPSLERLQINAGPLRSLLSQRWFRLIVAICCLALAVKLCHVSVSDGDGDAPGVGGRRSLTAAVSSPILVSYSYFEKDAIQNQNMQYFMSVGMGYSKGFKPLLDTHFVVVVSGEICTPCTPLLKALKQDFRVRYMPDLTDIYSTSNDNVTLLYRRENKGMDFAAHNVRSQLQCITSVDRNSCCRNFAHALPFVTRFEIFLGAI